MRINSPAYPRITRWITMCIQPKEMAAAASSSWKCFASNDPNFPLQSSPSAVEFKFAGTHAATLRRSIAAAINELSAERRRPAQTENQVRAMREAAPRSRWSGLSAPAEIHGEVGVLYLNDGRELLLSLQSMSVVPQGAV